MAKAPKLLSQTSKNYTKEEKERKQQAEKSMSQLKPLQKTPPNYLDDTAKREYRRITALLKELPIADLDLSLVVAYCQTYSNYVQATKHVNEYGLVTETERGTKLSSYYTAQRESTDRLISLSNKLGLNIDSRMKIFTPKDNKKKDDDIMSDFFDD